MTPCPLACRPQVLRHFNKTADALSNQAIDDYRSGANPHVWRLDAAAAFAGDSPLRYEEEEEDATDAAAGSKRAKRSY